MATESYEERLLRSVGIPASAQRLDFVKGPDAGHWLDACISEDLARELWSKWNPDQEDRFEKRAFREAFTQMLSDFVGLGLNLERLRDVCTALPEPGHERSQWISLFEQAVAGRDKCRVRVVMSPGMYRDCAENRKDDEGEAWT